MVHLLKKKSLADIAVNVLSPLILGTLIYYTGSILPSEGFITNQLPDGCWCYAFVSLMLIIWHRRINTFWTLAAFITAVSFEILQSMHFIPGTGDLWDVFAYCMASMLVLLFNHSFKIRFIIPRFTN